MPIEVIHTHIAPAPIGCYSQAIRVNDMVYLSGQIGMAVDADNQISTDLHEEIQQIFENIKAVSTAAGGSLEHIVKLTVFLQDMDYFAAVNDVMKTVFREPYPARAAIGVAALPKNARVEIDAIMVLEK